jgi:hypothetical protein
MGAIGLAEAAKLTGRNQSSIHRAMKAGRLSYTKNEVGERRIDVAELERVFGNLKIGNPILSGGNGASVSNHAAPDARKITHGGELAALQRLLEERERTIADLRDSIRDSRDRLDAEAEERRRIQERLTGLLTHRRGSPECEPQPPERTDRDERQADEPTDNLHGLYTEARRRPHRRDDQRRRRGGAAHPTRAQYRPAAMMEALACSASAARCRRPFRVGLRFAPPG